MHKEKISLIAVGDVMLGYEPDTLFDHVVDVLRSGDIAFANCDQVYSDKGHHNPAIFPSPSDPKNIPALVKSGLNVISLANNHTLDWGTDALLDTIERISKTEIKAVGVGKNITEARKPVILERKGTRVGFLAYGCVGPDGYEAWEDKPGYAPMRSWTIYEKWDYQPGTPPMIVTLAYRDDLAAMEEDIRKLKAQVDVVAVSFHWGLHMQPALIPMSGFEIGHAACDAGADIILGTHAHILKGIEVYKGKVIFHGQSNFAFRPWPPSGAPSSLRGHSQRPGRSFRDFYKFDPAEVLNTFIAKVIIEEGKISKVSYIPCHINKETQPEIVTRSDPRGQQVFDYIEKISRSQNLSTKFVWEGDEVVIYTE
jgi:hypothetical protein